MLKKILAVGVLLLLTACGGGGGGGEATTNPNAPVLTALTSSPTSANLNQGGGSVRVDFQFTVSDTQGDVQSGVINVFDSNNKNVASYNGPASMGLNNHYVMADTTVKGTFHYEIYVTDAQNNTSNKLTGTFTVI